ncbi:MAG: glycosyltransferase [Anaerolineales bacterium]|nr:glycosyltransferase [Anaerolineales bacterium]
MKILFLVPYAPNPIRTRPYNLLRALARRGHQITLATLWQNESERQDLARLAAEGIEILSAPLTRLRIARNLGRALPSRDPLQAWYCWEPKLLQMVIRAFVERTNNHWEIFHVEHLRGAKYALALQARFPDTPIVWDSVDCISHLFSQAAGQGQGFFGRRVTRFDLARTRRYEARLVRSLPHILVTSAQDRQALAALGAGGSPENITVLPNGVDLDYFHPNPAVERQPETLVVSGKMSYHANVSMVLQLVQDILPLIWQPRPAVRLVIAGADPPPALQTLAADERITLTGRVPDLRPALWSASAALAPLSYGAGIQNKVLEAMACGTPVISSPQGAAALQARPGKDLLVAADPGQFAAAIVQLLSDPAQQAQLSRAGRAYVTARHDWDQIAAQLEQYYTQHIHA